MSQLGVSIWVFKQLTRHSNNEFLKEILFRHVFVFFKVTIARLTLKPLVLLKSIIFHEMFEGNYICVFHKERPLHIKFHF